MCTTNSFTHVFISVYRRTSLCTGVRQCILVFVIVYGVRLNVQVYVSVHSTLRAPLSGTFLQRKDVVNQCLELVCTAVLDYVHMYLSRGKDVVNQCLEFVCTAVLDYVHMYLREARMS